MRNFINIINESQLALTVSEDIDTGQALSVQDRKDKNTASNNTDSAKAGDTVESPNGSRFEILDRDNDVVSLRRLSDGKKGKASLSTGFKLVSQKVSEGHAFPLVKDGDFSDPALDKPDNGDQKVETDFDKFKDEQEAGDPESSSEVAGSSKAEAEEVGKALNAKDMAIFSKGYQKLCAGAIDSISAPEAKELAEIMLALFKAKIEEPALEESNQDKKLAADAEASGQPVPANPNAAKSPADMRADKADAAATNNQTGQTDQANQTDQKNQTDQTGKPDTGETDDENTGEDAADFIKRKGVPVKK